MDIRLPKSDAEELYRGMRRIRRFEERVAELVDANEIAGVCHEYTGQEAVAVGVCAALNDEDVITSTHRGHGHVLAKGCEVPKMMAELFGRTSGYNHGRGGSMHIVDMSRGIYGANGIVAAGAPMACGAAYAFKEAGQRCVAVPFFGDGAINQGVLHEALNLGAIWTLPVVFICENNLYAVSTPLSDVSKLPPYKRAEAYGMPGVLVDGMDVQAVYEATVVAVQRARDGGGPTFIEAETYRYFGHYTAERLMKTTYRSDEEIESWKRRDAVSTWGSRLIAANISTEVEIAAINQTVEDELDAGIEFAREGGWPDPSDVLKYVYHTEYPDTPARGYEA